jgi:hypothetical protein
MLVDPIFGTVVLTTVAAATAAAAAAAEELYKDMLYTASTLCEHTHTHTQTEFTRRNLIYLDDLDQ